jgi:hypothetical protein
MDWRPPESKRPVIGVADSLHSSSFGNLGETLVAARSEGQNSIHFMKNRGLQTVATG